MEDFSIGVKMEMEARTRVYLQYLQELNTQLAGGSTPPSRFRETRRKIYDRLKEIFKVDCTGFFYVGLRPIEEKTGEFNYSLTVALKNTKSHAELLKAIEAQIKRENQQKKVE